MSKDQQEPGNPNLAGDGELGGIYSDFPGYEVASEQLVQDALKHGLIVCDANVLLNLYRYSPAASADFLTVLAVLADRLFIPHQAMDEFWRSREGVIQQRHDAVDTAKLAVDVGSREIRKALQEIVNRLGLAENEISDALHDLDNGLDSIGKMLKGHQDNMGNIDPADHAGDPVLSKLGPMLEGRVGRQPKAERIEAMIKEAKRRLDLRIPPGYADAKKPEARALGDGLFWLQSLEESKGRAMQLLVIVTDDGKEDWWRIEKGQKRGPRPELALEARTHHGARLVLMRPASLLHFAQDVFGLRLVGRTIPEVAAAQQQTSPQTTGWTPSTAGMLMDRLLAQASVQHAAILAAVRAGGFVDRDTVYQLGHYDSYRTLRGFTRPVRRIMQEMQDEDLVAESVPEPLLPVYDGTYEAGVASGFRVSPEFAGALRERLAVASGAPEVPVIGVRFVGQGPGDYVRYEVHTSQGVYIAEVSSSAMAQAYKNSMDAILIDFAKQELRREALPAGSTIANRLLAAEATAIDLRLSDGGA